MLTRVVEGYCNGNNNCNGVNVIPSLYVDTKC